MLELRPSENRGMTSTGWLASRHTFSFGYYHDNHWNGFGALRVINDDLVAPGGGFQPHGHRDMEIVTIVLSGALEHKDSLGTGSVITAGEVQRMRAGTGIRHSEFNASYDQPVHFLQVWIEPEKLGLAPDYAQGRFDGDAPQTLVASPDGRDGSLSIAQDAYIWRIRLGSGEETALQIPDGHMVWSQVTEGRISIGDTHLQEGDGAGIRNLSHLRLVAHAPATAYLFAVPAK